MSSASASSGHKAVHQQQRHQKQPVDEPTRSRCSCRDCPCACSTVLVIAFRLFLLSFLGVSIFLVIFFWAPLSQAFLSGIVFIDDQPTEWVALIVLGVNVMAALMFLPCLPFTWLRVICCVRCVAPSS